MIRVLKYITMIFVLAALAISCVGMKGQFGFRRFGDDAYRRIDGVPEFAGDEQVSWVYAFKKKYGEHEIGVVYLKKELVWVEVLNTSSRIDNAVRVVYGTIKDLPPGEYRIDITDVSNDNLLIDSKDFIVYDREDEE
ncbi:MAG: hypothetical protein A2176_03135 [Spirochaetes bacterium RBG_13_51_14]|nr:MAG: hypothetical protein A2176_03135 [Spirochaetes bacterium RBG_13_51_14]